MDPNSILVTKRASLQDAATKGFHSGYFILQTTRLTWQPDPEVPAREIHVGLIAITNTQRAKTSPMVRVTAGTNSYVFQFESIPARDAAVEAYTKAKEALNQAPSKPGSTSGAPARSATPVIEVSHGAAAPSKAAVSAAAAGLTSAQKKELLREDAEVADRFNALVITAQVLTEDEFWAGIIEERAKAAAAAAAGGATKQQQQGGPEKGKKDQALLPLPNPPDVAEQKQGLSNSVFQISITTDASGQQLRTNLTLTPELKAMVFASKPHVKKAYDKTVPSQMSEKDFWTRYVKHELAKEERRKRMLAASEGQSDVIITDADSAPLENSRLFEDRSAAANAGDGSSTEVVDKKTMMAEQRQVRKKLAAADPTVNLAANDADGFSEGFGFWHAANKEITSRKGLRAAAEDLARDINRHATVVLAGQKVLDTSAAQGASANPSSSSGVTKKRKRDVIDLDQAGDDKEPCMDDLAAQRLREYGHGLEDLRQEAVREFEVLRLPANRRPTSIVKQEPGLNDSVGPVTGAQHIKSEPQHAQHGMDVDHGSGTVQLDMQYVAAVVEHLDPNNLNHTPVFNQDAYKALLSVCGISLETSGQSGGAVLTSASTQSPDSILAPATLTKLRTQAKMVADVSKPFWACIKDGIKTEEQYDKAAKLARHIDTSLWPECEQVLQDANRSGGPERPVIKALLSPVQGMMEAVLNKFQEIQAQMGRG